MEAPREEEIVHLAGDRGVPTDPRRGMSSEMVNNETGATPQAQLSYRGRYAHPFPEKRLTCEIYAAEDGSLMVSTICVRCGHGLSITSQRKKIEWEPERGLFIEPFECTWELDGERRIAGLSLCRARVAYDGKTVRDA